MVGADLGCVVDGQMWWHLFPVVAPSLDDIPLVVQLVHQGLSCEGLV